MSQRPPRSTRAEAAGNGAISTEFAFGNWLALSRDRGHSLSVRDSAGGTGQAVRVVNVAN